MCYTLKSKTTNPKNYYYDDDDEEEWEIILSMFTPMCDSRLLAHVGL